MAVVLSAMAGWGVAGDRRCGELWELRAIGAYLILIVFPPFLRVRIRSTSSMNRDL
ncbi:hypothetical protein [Microcoleus sp. MON2_D5]|uniref:hypothetical protein n=1 Tax=Microcoleus sp. MON2_D5 TaxID=2818833 RepID=UPI002FD54C29